MNADFVKDRERIEAALPGRICHEIAAVVAKRNDHCAEVMAPIVRGFEAAKMIPFTDIAESAVRHRLLRRLDRAADTALNDLAADHVGKALSAINLWLNDLQEREVLEIGEESIFRATWDTFAGLLLMAEENGRILDAVDRSARKAAKRLRKRLEHAGYYCR